MRLGVCYNIQTLGSKYHFQIQTLIDQLRWSSFIVAAFK